VTTTLVPSIPLHSTVTLQTRDIQPRACMWDKLSATEKIVEEVLIDLMTETVMSKRVMFGSIQASSVRGLQASSSTAHEDESSQPSTEKRMRHRKYSLHKEGRED